MSLLSGLTTRQLREVLLQLSAVGVAVSVIEAAVFAIQAFLREGNDVLDGANENLEGIQVINPDMPEEESKCVLIFVCVHVCVCMCVYVCVYV